MPAKLLTSSPPHSRIWGRSSARRRHRRRGRAGWGSPAKVRVGFTDQEQDDTVGLNMRGRMYDATTRTFLTPDPIVGSPLKVSGWNKYAYVLNNPLKYVDPSGFEGEEGALAAEAA
jgi:RHS repeat-associated protein